MDVLEGSNLNWLISAAVTALFAGVGAGYAFFKRTDKYAKLDKKTKIILSIVAAAVGFVERTYVVPQKRANASGKLTEKQQDIAATKAMRQARSIAGDIKVEDPRIASDSALLGHIEAAVATQKKTAEITAISDAIVEREEEDKSVQRKRTISGPGRPRAKNTK